MIALLQGNQMIGIDAGRSFTFMMDFFCLFQGAFVE